MPTRLTSLQTRPQHAKRAIMLSDNMENSSLLEDERDEPSDLIWMRQALDLARQAGEIGEIPVGALIVNDSGLISTAFNRKETLFSAIGHAEIFAIQAACEKLQRWRLFDCTLYVTLEPCVMCAGAIVQGRLRRVVYGARDPRAGAVDSVYSVFRDGKLNHTPLVRAGVLEAESSRLLKDFFARLRTRP